MQKVKIGGVVHVHEEQEELVRLCGLVTGGELFKFYFNFFVCIVTGATAQYGAKVTCIHLLDM